MTGGCDKSDQSTIAQINSNDQLTTRTVASCDDCPIDDCCCAIELQFPSTGSANLRLCGTSNGFGLCSPPTPPGPCSSISGGADAMMLDLNNIRDLFCMNKGSSFSIFNNAGGTPPDIKVSCRYNQTSANFINVTFDANGYAYFDVEDDCELTVCQ